MTEVRKIERIDTEGFGGGTADAEWHCVCGNEAERDGFYPCDESGDAVEPEEGSWPVPLYRCDRCGRIVLDAGSMEPVTNQGGAWVVGSCDLATVRMMPEDEKEDVR